MRKFIIVLLLLVSCQTSYAKRLDEMNSNTSPDITNDLIYSQDVSDTSEASQGTGKKLTIKNLLKAGNITVDGTNVGINSVNPTQRLDVVGTIKATAFIGDGSGLTGVAASASDAAYGVAWDGDTTGIASKNSLYDKIESIVVSGGGWVDDGAIIHPTTTTDNVGIGTATASSRLHVYGGGIKGELVNKGWEKVLQDQSMNPPGNLFSEINSFGVHKNEMYIGYDISGTGSGAFRKVPIYKWDGNILTRHSILGSGSNMGGVAFLQSYNGKFYAGVQGRDIGHGDIYVLDETDTSPQLFFNTTSTSVSVPNDSSNNAISGSTSFSIEWKGNPFGVGENSVGRIVHKMGSGTSSGYRVYIDSTYHIKVGIASGGTEKTTTTTDTVGINEPVHIVVTWSNGSAPKIYIDGVEATYSGTTSVTTPSDDTANSLIIGNNSLSTATFDGMMNRLRIFRNKELTSGEVSTLYADGTVSGDTGEYLFTDGSGTTLTDSSGNGNNGTITDGEWDTKHWLKSYDETSVPFSYAAAVFKGKLYVGMGYWNSKIKVFDGTTWSTAYNGLSGAGAVFGMRVFNGRIYAALGSSAGLTTSAIVSSADGQNWVVELSVASSIVNEFNILQDFRGRLYVNMIKGGSGTNTLYIRDNDTATWSPLSEVFVAGQCWGMAEYNDVLYVGCSDAPRTAVIYKSFDGVNFEEDFIPDSAGVNYEYEAFRMINFNGSLYVGMGGDGLYSANIWRKTDSLGQLFDTDHRVVKNFNFRYDGINWNNDESIIGLSSPINFQNNVGVGTWNPLQKLHVVGTVNATAFVGDGSGLTGISGGASGWTDGGTNVYTTTSTDSLGIGTTTPTGRVDIRGDEVRIWTGAGTNTNATSAGELYVEGDLEVDGTAYIGGAVTATGAVTGSNLSGTNTGDQTTVTGNAGTATALAVNGTNCSAGNYPLGVDASGNAEDCTLASGGSIGIGTANTITFWPTTTTIGSLPTATYPSLTELSYVKDVTSAIQAQLNAKDSVTTAGDFITRTANDFDVDVLDEDDMTSNSAVHLATQQSIKAYVDTAISGVSGGVGGWTDGGTNVYTTTTTDKVGIGTTTPFSDSMLTVKGSTATGTDDFIGLFVQNGVTPDVISVAGIAHKTVIVQGDGGAYLGGRDVTNDIEFLMGTSTLGIGFGGTSSNHPFGLRSNNLTRIQIGTDGNVGVGTINPNARMTVMGTGTGATPIQTWRNSSSTQRMVVMDNGTVGIGTAGPRSMLDVAGDVTVGNGTFTNTSANEDLYVEGNLEVDGTLYGDGSQLTGIAAGGWVDGGTNVYVSPTTDNVGIGTTTPSTNFKADVRGNLYVSGNVGIGTLLPRGTLDLGPTGTIYTQTITGPTGPTILGTSNNVGIGTITAGSLLTVGTTGQAAITSAGVATLPTPILTGKIDINNVAVNDDDCTGEQGLLWYDSTDNAFEFCKNNSGTPERLGQPSPPASQTITAGATITADACGTFKDISSAGAVTTDTTNTFTAPSSDLSGCCMNVVNTGANNITLDNNSLFYSAGAADVVLGLADSAIVCTNGTVWAQMGGSNN